MSQLTKTLTVLAITFTCMSSVYATNKYGRTKVFSEADFGDWQVYVSEDIAKVATSTPLKSKLIYQCSFSNKTTCNFSYSSPYSRITMKSADIEFKFKGSKHLHPARIKNATALAAITLESELLSDFMENNVVEVSLYDTDTGENISRDNFSLNGSKEAFEEFLKVAIGSKIQSINQTGIEIAKAEW